MILAALQRYAYPAYNCELCVGQEMGIGCYCMYHGACGPDNAPPCSRLRLVVRWSIEWWHRTRR